MAIPTTAPVIDVPMNNLAMADEQGRTSLPTYHPNRGAIKQGWVWEY
jgi:hypothetical protein